MKVSELTKRIDDIDYKVAVREEISGYFGSWFCRKCWQGGVNFDLLPTIDDALAQAEKAACLHHENNHASS